MSLTTLVKTFNKDHKAEIVKVGVQVDDPERLPSGIFQLDLQLGGGIPEGRVTVVYGTESSGKTTLCLKLIAAAQRKYPDKKAVFVDLEGTFSTSWAKQMGVDTDALVYVKPYNAEQAVDIMQALIHEAEDVSFIALDSLAALVTQRELESSADQAMVGVQGLLINKLYRKVVQAMGEVQHAKGFSPTVVLVNQIRFKVGVTMGDPEVQPGGPSFKFAASLTLRTYGKDEMMKEVSTKLPAFKKVSVIVKKWKVPITARSSEFLIALIPNDKLKLKVGDSYDIGTIMHYLKSFELLSKGPKGGWAICDEHGEIFAEAKTQDALENQMRDDPDFSKKIRDLILRVVVEKGDLIDAE